MPRVYRLHLCVPPCRLANGIEHRLKRQQENLTKPDIPAAIAKARSRQAERTALTADLPQKCQVLSGSPGEQVAGLREGRHPSAADEPRVPTDVIGVQMRAARDARLGKLADRTGCPVDPWGRGRSRDPGELRFG